MCLMWFLQRRLWAASSSVLRVHLCHAWLSSLLLCLHGVGWLVIAIIRVPACLLGFYGLFYPISILYHHGHVALQSFIIHVRTEARNYPELSTPSVFHVIEVIYNMKYVGIHLSSRDHFSFSHRWLLMKRKGRLRSGMFLNFYPPVLRT